VDERQSGSRSWADQPADFRKRAAARIELFAQLGLIEVVEPAAGPDEIAATVERALRAGAPEPCKLPLDGAARVARELLELLG
jgi:predicted glycosyltransferase